MPISAIFSQKALEVVPRVLGLCDRDPASPSFGCCDRNYWHYRLNDLPNARTQEAGLLLALVHSVPFPGNRFYQNEKLKTWIRGIWSFWLKRRNRDGSVNEAYPFERSFCATAFSCAAFAQSVFLMGGAAAWQGELEAARPSADWLMKNPQTDTANQMAASYLALSGYAALTRDARYAQGTLRRRGEVLDLANPDGVFGEYGGFDTGYQSITMSLLARASVWCGGDPGILDLLAKGEKLLAKRLSIFGETDAAQNSRNTQFVYPYGLAVLQSTGLGSLEAGIEAGRVLVPGWMDDRYCVPLAADYAMTSEEFFRCS